MTKNKNYLDVKPGMLLAHLQSPKQPYLVIKVFGQTDFECKATITLLSPFALFRKWHLDKGDWAEFK